MPDPGEKRATAVVMLQIPFERPEWDDEAIKDYLVDHIYDNVPEQWWSHSEPVITVVRHDLTPQPA